ncbi:HD-GYP domain-containing protein [Salirhabdus salicampi]|uniref:HD-GYP domain-containing protein n=1 Tax=Salirhabdus salicampi TaxID=476102 RepID=UPI0020C26A95|nr:HD-GYP domain-containing protein [Salirhabdus salicampi]MCP8615363.1 HD-GYP domain-containing protein [Salirhabdus salicampi]
MKFNRLLNHPRYFRYAFIIVMVFSLIINILLPETKSDLFILYIFGSIFLGLGFYDRPVWLIIVLAFLIVICRFFLIPEPMLGILTFVTLLFTYILITFISVGLMKHFQQIQRDNIKLIHALANALDSRDPYTMNHSKNVAQYSVLIAKKLRLTDELCKVIHIGGLLHDIGKIGIPEYVLNKTGKLSKEEYEIIKRHPTLGYEMIKHIDSFNESGVLDIILYHHERFDGKGYPKGLKGTEIPLTARIVAIADAFDAMSSQRIYRDELKIDDILSELISNKGKQFDSDLVDTFIDLIEKGNTFFKEKQRFTLME